MNLSENLKTIPSRYNLSLIDRLDIEEAADIREELESLKSILRAYFLENDPHLRTFIVEKILRVPSLNWIEKAKQEGWL